MSRVAADLGVSTMSLYRYVGAKDELLALMVDLTFEAPPAAGARRRSWRGGLARWAWMRAGGVPAQPLGAHPHQRPASHPQRHGLAGGQSWTACRTPGSVRTKLSVMLLLTGQSAARRPQAEVAAARAPAPPARPPADGLLRAAAGPPGRPQAGSALHAVIAAGVFDEPDEDDYDFRFGLERVLDGIETLIDKRRTARGC